MTDSCPNRPELSRALSKVPGTGFSAGRTPAVAEGPENPLVPNLLVPGTGSRLSTQTSGVNFLFGVVSATIGLPPGRDSCVLPTPPPLFDFAAVRTGPSPTRGTAEVGQLETLRQIAPERSSGTPQRTPSLFVRMDERMIIGSWNRTCLAGIGVLLGCTWALIPPAAAVGQENVAQDDSSLLQLGEEIYRDSCADCHGESGQGVEGSYETPLIGDDSIGQLEKRITETMPEGDAESCVGPDARAVAVYIHQTFYSEAAQIRNRPPRIGVARLTAEQLRQSYADLYAALANGNAGANEKRGLQAVYFNADRWKKEELKLDTVVPTIDFDFGREAPIEGVDPKKFYIMFKGGLFVENSGPYELIVRSSCSFTMDFGRDGRRVIDNHVQSGDKTEFRYPVQLTGGRTYPLRINFTQRERKTEAPPAWIHLSWVRPGGVEEVIPESNLIPGWVPPTYALQTELPPDDRSYGFERGIDVNRQWDEATTKAALEFSDVVIEELWPQYEKNTKEPADVDKKLEQFLTKLVETAFRWPLDESQKQVYISKQLERTEDRKEAIRRSILISLKSPYFLYPDVAELRASPSGRIASQLALILFDSLPADNPLQELARRETVDEKAVEQLVWRAFNDGRVRGKMLRFLHYWLDVHATREITKSQELYPGFNADIVYDLQQSLDRFLLSVIDSPEADYRRFFNTDWAYGTPRLAQFYGEPWAPATELESEDEVKPRFYQTVAAPERRYGVLTHPYITSSLAYHDTTSPIHRGVFLIRFVLGRNLRPPQAAFSPLSPDLHPDLTTRERVEKQTSPQECQACHVKINGLGFALENYDAVGRFRADEKNRPIDSTGAYVDRSGQSVQFGGAKDLASYLIESPDAHRAFVNKMFQYFVKQPPAAYGSGTLDRLTEKFQASGFNIRTLLVEIVKTAALQPGPESVGFPAVDSQP